MKLNILLSLCLSIFLTSCNDDANPAALQVTMSSSSQTLVEGGEAIEVIVENDRTFKELKFLYLGGVGGLLDEDVTNDYGWIHAEVDGKQQHLKRIPMPSGESKRTLRLQVDKDEVYQGNSTFEIKAYSYENGVVLLRTSLSIDYQDTTPKPVFGFFRMDEYDVAITVNRMQLHNQDPYFIPIMADRSFTQPQKVTLTFSGTAEEDVHYEKEAQIVLNPEHFPRRFQGNRYPVLRINKTAKFDPEKVIHIKLAAAEDGTIANGEEFNWPYIVGPFNMVNTYTLTVTE